MPEISVCRTDLEMLNESELEYVRRFLFGIFDGASADDRRAWRRFWKALLRLLPGEIAKCFFSIPRSGPFHRRHFAMLNLLFDSQERFEDFEQFRIWLKVGAGYVDWLPGPKGGVIPVPRSVSYEKCRDEEVFYRAHKAMVDFLRTGHAQKTLWKHLRPDQRSEMIETILKEFDE